MMTLRVEEPIFILIIYPVIIGSTPQNQLALLTGLFLQITFIIWEFL